MYFNMVSELGLEGASVVEAVDLWEDKDSMSKIWGHRRWATGDDGGLLEMLPADRLSPDWVVHKVVNGLEKEPGTW